MESYEQCGQGQSYCSLCTLYTIHRLFFVTRLIINKINKVQWVDFKLENDLVSLHSLKKMGLGSIIFKEWRVTWTFSYTYITYHYYYTLIYHLPLLLHTYISLTITITHLYHSPLITHGSIYIYRCSDLFSKLVCVQLFWQQRIISSYLNRLLKMRSG